MIEAMTAITTAATAMSLETMNVRSGSLENW